MKKIFLCIFFCISMFFVCACTSKNPKKEKNTIYIYNWSHYVPHTVIEEFTKTTGIKVVYDCYESQEALEAKLMTHCGYDVVFLPALPTLALAIQNKLLAPLQWKWLPNRVHLAPWIYKNMEAIDPGLAYSVPYMGGTTGIGYDSRRVGPLVSPEALDSWGLFFDPKNAKALADKGVRISLLDSATDTLQGALLYLGLSPRSTERAHWDRAIACVKKILPYIAAFESSRQLESFLDGQNAAMQIYSTYGNIARHEAQALGLARHLHYVIPKEGAVMWIDMMAIPKEAPNIKGAHAFMNFIIRPDISAKVSGAVWGISPVKGVEKFFNSQQKAALCLDGQTMQRVFGDWMLPANLKRYIFQQWLKLRFGG